MFNLGMEGHMAQIISRHWSVCCGLTFSAGGVVSFLFAFLCLSRCGWEQQAGSDDSISFPFLSLTHKLAVFSLLSLFYLLSWNASERNLFHWSDWNWSCASVRISAFAGDCCYFSFTLYSACHCCTSRSGMKDFVVTYIILPMKWDDFRMAPYGKLFSLIWLGHLK